MFALRRLRAAGLVAVCLLLFPAVLRADVLTEAIPDNATVVVIANDLTKLENDAKAFAQSSDLDVNVDITERVTEHFGDAVALAQGAAFVLVAPDPQGGAFLIPVNDIEAALKAAKAEKQGEHYEAELGGHRWMILAKDKLLVVANEAQSLEPFRSPAKTIDQRWTDAEKKVRSEVDVYAYVGMEPLRPVLNAALDQADAFIDQIAGGGAFGPFGQGMDPKVMAGFLKWYVRGARALVEQTELLQGGVDIDGSRILGQGELAFREGSELRGRIAKLGPPRGDLLAGLPAMPFYMAGGVDVTALNVLVPDMMQSMLDVYSGKMNDQQKEQMAADFAKFWGNVKAFNMLFDFGKEGMTGVGLYFADDPKALQRAYRKSTEASKEMMKMFMPGGEIEVASKNVVGIDVDEYTVDLSKMPAEARQALQAMYGERGMRWQMGAVGKALAYAMGPQEDPITLLTSKKENFTAEKRIQSVLSLLPEERYAVIMIDPFGFLGAAKRWTGGVGLPFNIEMPDPLPPPFAKVVTKTDRGLGAHWAVRPELVRAFAKLRPGQQ